ncbi:MAG: GTPase ObgE [Firmicutes bacterium]|nr:GTPase ObgE [Bacillota bacterium]
MFLDKVKINIKAGNGGNGHTSFFRDKKNMWGGPDGGDGGRGGDVVFIGGTKDDNLVSFRFNKKYHAPDGENGGKQRKKGKSGGIYHVEVPLGTRAYNIHGELLADITEVGQEYVALKGGGGGLGNSHFATSRKQTPNFSQLGEPTKAHDIFLELHTIADIGLVGFPNVGKSSLLASLTRAQPKIANYHFTTLHPNVGVWNGADRNLVLADIPGLIEGASEGVGLGHEFLRHINRTKVLFHVIDISGTEGRNPIEDFHTINNELKNFSSDLAHKPQIIILNKLDIADPKIIKEFRKAMGKGKKVPPVFETSAATHAGLVDLMNKALEIISKLPDPESPEISTVLEKPVDKNEFYVYQDEGAFVVTGPLVDNLARGVVLNDTESNYYFQKRLLNSGVIRELKKQGMVTGSIVNVGGVEFEWMD